MKPTRQALSYQSRFSNYRVCRKCEKVKEKYIKESIVEEHGMENCRKENMRERQRETQFLKQGFLFLEEENKRRRCKR